MKKITEQNVVVITGNVGCGKTYLSHHTALKMRDKGYKIVPVDDPAQIMQYCIQGTRTLFVVDNVCGLVTLNKTYLDNWISNLESIEKLLVASSKILATFRLHVFNDVRLQKSISMFKKNECNICSERLSLSLKERKKFVQTYFKEDTGQIYDGSTVCMSNPYIFFESDLERLYQNGKEDKRMYCALVLCVMFNNNLTDELIMSKSMKSCLRDVFMECKLPKSETGKGIQQSLKQLLGVYICDTGKGRYEVIHDMLFDIFARYFIKRSTVLFIKYADPLFIKERFLWANNKDTDKSFDLCVNLNKKNLNEYFKRLEKDWSSGGVDVVFDNRNMDSEVFRQKFLSYLEKLEFPTQKDLVQTKDSKTGETPLYHISHYGDIMFIKWMLNNGADYRYNLYSSLKVACQEGCTDLVRFLVQHYKTNNINDKHEITLLQIACHKNHDDVVKVLLQCEDVKVDQCDSNGHTALYQGCQEGHLNIVKVLIQHSADINKSNKNGASPLYVASQNGHVMVVEELLRNSVDINKCRHDNTSPLQIACYYNHPDVVEQLLRLPEIDINQSDEDGCTSLYHACQEGNLDIVTTLLNHSADINKSNKNEASPLYIASENGHSTVVNTLLQNSADINISEKSGASPLYIACQKGHIKVVRVLIQHLANINQSKLNGTSPLYIACQNGHALVVKELIKHSADINKGRCDGITPLQIACYYNREDVVRELLFSEEINIDQCDSTGCTSLHVACKKGHTFIIDELIQHKADKNKPDNTGRTPLQIASKFGRDKMVKSLQKAGL